MIKIRLFFLVIALVFSTQVRSGVPVLSPTELVQAVLEYSQILKDYEEQLNLVEQGYEQYQQMQKEYLLALQEWENILDQCQAYKDLWGSHDWDNFLNEMTKYFISKRAYSHNQIMSLYEDENYRKSRTLLMTKSGKVYTYQSAMELLDRLKIKDEYAYEDLRIKENQVNDSVKRMSFNSSTSSQITDFVQQVDDLESDFEVLGDNSQLATMQYQAKLQSKGLDMQLLQLTLLNELISQQNQPNDIQAIKLLQAQTRAYENAERALNKKIKINNSNNKINF